MTLDHALTAPILSLSDSDLETAMKLLGAEKLRVRQGMDWNKTLVAMEVGLRQSRETVQWRRLREINARLAHVHARMFKTAGHVW